VRSVLPERRSSVPAALNRHSLKNRFLMRIKNVDGQVWRRCAWRGVARDVVVLGACFAWDWRMLPALWDLATAVPRARSRRAQIQSRRRRGGREVAQWFE
jgi:hypothetical protein